MADTRHTASDFRLIETTGGKRELILRREAMPFQPAAFPLKTRLTKTLYQGNVDATIQLFGPEFGDLTFKGCWRNQQLRVRPDSPDLAKAVLDGVPLDKAEKLVKAFEDLWLGGQELQLHWQDRVYRGHIGDFEPNYRIAEIIEWSLAFVVAGPGDVPSRCDYLPDYDFRAAAGGLLASIGSAMNAITAALNKVVALRKKIQSHIDRVDQLRKQLEGVIALATDVILSPLTLASRLIQVATDLTQVWQAMKRAAASANAAVMALTGKASDFIRAYSGQSEVVYQSRIAGMRTRKDIAAARRALSPRVIKIVRMREGGDLRRVAVDVYGSAGGWSTIAAYNGLSDAAVPPGRMILVPELRAA